MSLAKRQTAATDGLRHGVAVSDGAAARKRRRVRVLQRYLLNPPMKAATWLGVYPGHVLLETRGRRTGRRRRTVVGLHREGGHGWVVAEQGRHAGYVANIAADPSVRVRSRARWRHARAFLEPADDPIARLSMFPRVHGATVRRFGTDLLSIRIDFTDGK